MSQFLKSNSKNDTDTKSEIKSRFKNEFINIKCLGIGGFGVVFKVKDKVSKFIYAIKQIELDRIELLERETKIKELSHRNIVKFFDFWLEKPSIDDNTYLYIKMELCHEDNLAAWLLKSDKHVRKNRFLSIFQEIVEAVTYIHSKGLIHRDLKPDNVLFSLDGRTIKLADFGTIVKHANLDENGIIQRRKKNHVIHSNGVGTLWYEAPEVEGKKYDFKADIFSLGVILFELITPFTVEKERDDAIEELNRRSFPKRANADLKREFLFVKKMVSPYPEKRPTIKEVRKRVAEWTLVPIDRPSIDFFSFFLHCFSLVEVIVIYQLPTYLPPRFEKNRPRKIKKDYKLLH